MVFTIEVLLGREQEGGPSICTSTPGGSIPKSRTSVHICDELVREPIDRDRLRAQATALLSAAER